MFNMFDLKGKTALVTGGAKGIGLAIAEGLGEAGANVIIADINEEALQLGLSHLRDAGINAMSIKVDVSSHESVRSMVARIRESGGVDIFVSSAAITNRKILSDMTDEEWDRIMKVNLYGAFFAGTEISRLMIDQGRGGRMIFIVSTGAYRAGEKFGAYSASKAGVVMLMKTFALELAKHGILCNAIAPTATDTDFTRDYYAANPDVLKRVTANHPLGRIANANDYKGTAVYLASEASAFMTGTLITVDGGKTAK